MTHHPRPTAARAAGIRFAAALHYAFHGTLMITALAPASTVNFAIECNNDFALFSGDASNATTLLYQNDTAWDSTGSQSAAAAGAAPTVVGEYLYLVAMAAGGENGLWGTFNGIDLASIAGVEVSSPLALDFGNGNASLVDASFDLGLLELQEQLDDPSLLWSAATPVTVGTGGSWSWTGLSPDSQLYDFADGHGPNSARVFRFLAQNAATAGAIANIPAGGGMVALAAGAIGFRTRRRSPH